jgi:thiol-disulfide isomerase/thioredoxin
MNLAFAFVATIALFSIPTEGQTQSSRETGFTIRGQISGFEIVKDDSLDLYWIEDMVSPANYHNRQFRKVHVARNGGFTINVPDVQHITKVMLFFNRAGIGLIEHLSMFPGDDVHVLASHQSGSWNFKYTGKGGKRLQHHFINEFVLRYEGERTTLAAVDTIVQRKWKLIDKQRFKTETARFLKAEMLGGILRSLHGAMLFSDSGARHALRNELESISDYAWFREVNEYPISIQASAPGWIEGLYTVNNQLLVNRKDSTYGYFDAVYKRIEQKYSGRIRDRLLLHHVSNTPNIQFHNYFPAGTFETYMDRLDSLAEDKKVKDIISSMKSRLTKGSEVYPFTFYDRHGKAWTPKELKGKFVFFDLWGIGCGACLHTNEAFIQKVSPYISHDSIVVFSVCDSQDKEEWLKSIPAYSSEEHLNVYAPDIGEVLKFQNYYSVAGYPFVMLIDPEGKIYSSNPPLAYRPGNDLLKEIRAAIADYYRAASTHAATQKQ